MVNQGEQGSLRGRGHAEPERTENRPQERQTLIDMAADEKLGRGLPLQLQGFRRGCLEGGLKIDPGGLGPPTAVGQRVAQLLAQPALGGGRTALSSIARR